MFNPILKRETNSPITRKKPILQSQPFIEKLSRFQTLKGHRGCVNSVLYSNDGNFVYTGSDDTYVHIYDADSGNLKVKIPTKHTNNVFYAKDLPYDDGFTLITCAADGRVLIVDSMKTSSNCSEVYR